MKKERSTAIELETRNEIIVIGAGITGLSAGIHALRNGFKVRIFESHFLPGGMCTAWKRKGYTFEGCLHYVLLTGSSPRHIFYQHWLDLGVIPNMEFYNPEVFHAFRDRDGRTLNLYTDADRLQEELLAFSPRDKKEIKALTRIIKRYTWFIRETGRNPLLWLRKMAEILITIPQLKKFGEIDIEDYTQRFHDPLLREALAYLFIQPEFAAISLFFILAGKHMKAAGYPLGGSLALAKTIENHFLELGGEILYRKQVSCILVENNQAVGVRLEDGSEEKADFVISTGDGLNTLQTLLGDAYTPENLRERFETKSLYPAFIQVSLGVERDMCAEPHALKVKVEQPFEIAGVTRDQLWICHFSFDPDFAPKGKTALIVLYPSSMDWWEKIGYDTPEYKREKENILAETLAQLEMIMPGIGLQIEVQDVSTPYTWLRYTHNWQGAPGFMMTKELTGELTLHPQYTLPGLENFYMAGQWVNGFGVPNAAAAGKDVISKLCQTARKK